MTLPDGVDVLVYELRAKLGVSGVEASTITLHFSDDGRVQKIIPEIVFKRQKEIDARVKTA